MWEAILVCTIVRRAISPRSGVRYILKTKSRSVWSPKNIFILDLTVKKPKSVVRVWLLRSWGGSCVRASLLGGRDRTSGCIGSGWYSTERQSNIHKTCSFPNLDLWPKQNLTMWTLLGINNCVFRRGGSPSLQ